MSDNNFIKASDASLVPEKVVSTYGNDGSKHTSFVYSLESWATLNLFSIFSVVAFILTFIPIASVIFFFFYLLRIHVRPLPNSHNLFGALASLYLLIDYHNGWVMSRLIGCFFSHQYQYLILYANLALLFTHTILLFLGTTILGSTRSRVASMIAVLVLFIISFFISKGLIDSHFFTFIVKSIE